MCTGKISPSTLSDFSVFGFERKDRGIVDGENLKSNPFVTKGETLVKESLYKCCQFSWGLPSARWRATGAH